MKSKLRDKNRRRWNLSWRTTTCLICHRLNLALTACPCRSSKYQATTHQNNWLHPCNLRFISSWKMVYSLKKSTIWGCSNIAAEFLSLKTQMSQLTSTQGTIATTTRKAMTLIPIWRTIDQIWPLLIWLKSLRQKIHSQWSSLNLRSRTTTPLVNDTPRWSKSSRRMDLSANKTYCFTETQSSIMTMTW